jgi:TIGR03009 family protein
MARPRTAWVSVGVALLWSGLSIASAQERGEPRAAVAAPAQAAPQINMDQLLTMWAKQSATLNTLELAIYRVDRDAAWGEEEHYVGHAAFENPQRAYLDFRKVKLQAQADPKNKDKKLFVPVKKNNQVESKAYETIICTGQEVWHYSYDVRRIFVYPLDKNQRKRALEEGPLPFLFNMKAEEAKARYEMTLKEQNEKGYLVKIKPLLREDVDSFSTAYIWLDRKWLLPTRIYLLAPDNKSSKDFKLSQIHANEPVNPIRFKGVDPGKPWKLERNPGGPAPAEQAGGATARRANVGKAAQRPSAPDVNGPR